MITGAGRRLGGRRAVVDTAADEIVGPGRLELPVAHPRGQHDGMAEHAGAVVEDHPPGRTLHLKTDRCPRRDELRAEPQRLTSRPIGELAAGHAVGEAEIVLDPRALTGLAAGLLAQREAFALDMLEAVLLAVYLHGLAGDLAAARVGEQALAAGDLLDFVPAAFAGLRGDRI